MENKLLGRFAENHPDTLATALAEKTVPEIERSLFSLAPNLHAKVLAALPSSRLAECMTLMTARSVSSALISGGQRETLSLIAHLPNKRYQEIVDASDSNREKLSARLFAHSEKTLGSIADARFVTVRQRTQVSELKAQLEQMQGFEEQPVYLLDSEGALIGSVPQLPIFSLANQSLLVDGLAVEVDPLPATLEIEAARDARQWERNYIVPIVNESDELVGTVKQEQLTDHPREDDFHTIEGIVGELMLGYLDVGAKLLSLTLGEDRDGTR